MVGMRRSLVAVVALVVVTPLALTACSGDEAKPAEAAWVGTAPSVPAPSAGVPESALCRYIGERAVTVVLKQTRHRDFVRGPALKAIQP